MDGRWVEESIKAQEGKSEWFQQRRGRKRPTIKSNLERGEEEVVASATLQPIIEIPIQGLMEESKNQVTAAEGQRVTRYY